MNGSPAGPLTSSQQQLWFIDEFHHGLPAHNLPHKLTLTGQLDLAAFRRAIDGLVARHAALRTRLPAGPDGMPVLQTDPPGPVRLEFTDLTPMSAGAATARLGEIAAAESARPFRLAASWPVRANLVRLSARQHVLVLVVHQVAFDGASAAIFAADLAALYEAEVAGKPAPAGPPLTFADYAAAEPGRIRAEDELYWKGALAGLPTSRFPADRPRPLLASHDGAVETTTIGTAVLAGLRRLASREDTTLQVILLAALHAMLCRYTGQADLVIGTAVPNRDPGPNRDRLPPLIGFVEATVPIRADLSGDPSFAELLGRVSQAVAGAVAHQDLPFARIVDLLAIERDTGRFPVFQTWLRCREPTGDVTAAGVTFRIEPAELLASRYDLGIDARPGQQSMDLAATYPSALFDQATVRRLLGHFGVLLAGIAADPAAPLSRLPLLTEAELHRELVEWNDTARQFPRITIIEGFERQARRTPDAVAAEFGGVGGVVPPGQHSGGVGGVVPPGQHSGGVGGVVPPGQHSGGVSVSYAELDRRAELIGRQLRDAGVGPRPWSGCACGRRSPGSPPCSASGRPAAATSRLTPACPPSGWPT